MKIVSWNVNSIRSKEDKFLEFMENFQPDILILQELRAMPENLSMFLRSILNYNVLFNPAKKPGYSGTAIYYKNSVNLNHLTNYLGIPILDDEGRTIIGGIDKITLVSLYTPNGNRNEERLKYKLNYYQEIFNYIKKLLNNGQEIILGGDLNVAHTELDLFDPNGNRNHSGFLIEERKWFNDLLDLGFYDTFRMFEKSGGHYSWWHMRDPERKNNNGWRFDYFLVSKNLVSKVRNARILRDVFGSDHCPILLEIDL